MKAWTHQGVDRSERTHIVRPPLDHAPGFKSINPSFPKEILRSDVSHILQICRQTAEFLCFAIREKSLNSRAQNRCTHKKQRHVLLGPSRRSGYNHIYPLHRESARTQTSIMVGPCLETWCVVPRSVSWQFMYEEVKGEDNGTY